MKLRQEKIFGLLPECPVRLEWCRGRFDRTALAHHKECEFQFFLKGRGVYFISGLKYNFRSNMVLSIHPRKSHCSVMAPGCLLEKWRLMFKPEFLNNAKLRRLVETAPPQATLTAAETAAITLLFSRLKDEFDRQEAHWLEIARLKLGEFLWLLHRAGARPVPAPVENQLAAQIAEYLERKFAHPLRIAELAELFGYSESHLAHVFKEHMQVGIKQYAIQRRIAEARRQLEENPEIKMAAVAESVGFQNFGVFNRNFKQLTGVTPTVYSRNSHQGCRM